MDKNKKPEEKARNFIVLHQLVAVPHIDFANKRLIGYTELQIKLLNPEQKVIRLNSKQCRIFRVAVNTDFEAEFSLVDPTLDVCQTDTKKRNLDHFSNYHASVGKIVDPDYGGGELSITLPAHYTPSFSVATTAPNTRSHGYDIITLGIEFMLENPDSGLYFVVPPYQTDKSHAERGAYLITAGHQNSSRLWFPCVDSFSELCTWKLEITVDKDMTAVSCGDLVSTQMTPDYKQQTFHYVMNVPVSAPLIALAVGYILTDPHMNEMVHYCLPHLLPLMKHATSFLHQAFEFCEEYLTSRYPYSIYKQVFVDQTYTDLASYATMSVINCSYLFPKHVIEQNISSRSIMALGVCRQFFGYYLTPSSWKDMWITDGVARYLHGLYYRKYFGNNEYRYQIYQQTKEITTFERDIHPIILVPPDDAGPQFHFPPHNPQTCSEEYCRIYSVKAHLVVRMLEERAGAQTLAQVFNKMLSLAAIAAVSKEYESWGSLLLSTEDFIKGITTITTKDIQPFFDKWVYAGGHARFKGRFTFNRKRNMVEMELSQELGTKACTSYFGPLPIYLQELDGSSKHTVQVEENSNKHDLVCHSKTRRHKKKKIPLWTGEEIDIDLNEADADCPVLWIRIDPDMTIIRSVVFEQPDYHLQFIVRHERDVIAQLAALEALNAFPTQITKAILSTVMENEKIFYRIRLAAAESLTRLSNQLISTGAQWTNPPPMYALYKKMFFVRLPSTVAAGAPVASNIVRRNDFHYFVKYFLQKSIPVFMAKIRNSNNVCPPEIVSMLLDMWKYNENRKNFYSDSYYRAALIEAFGETFTESAGTLSVSEDPKFQFEQLGSIAKQCMENIFRGLNQEKLLPSHQYVVTVSCLGAIRNMQKTGILPAEWCVKLYRDYTDPKLYRSVRIAAFTHLVNHLQTTAKNSPNKDLFDVLLKNAATDPDPFMRHSVLRLLISNPPFTKDAAKTEDCALSTEALVERLWKWMNSEAAYDARIRCDVVDLYHVLYGRRRPACVPIPDLGMVLNLKERKAVLSVAAMASLEVKTVTPSPPAAVEMDVDKVKEEPGEIRSDSSKDNGSEKDDLSETISPEAAAMPKIKFKVGDSAAPSPSEGSPKTERSHDDPHRKKKKKHKHKHHHSKHRKADRDSD